MTLFLQLLVNGLVNGAIFSLLASAFGVVYRSVGVFHIAFAGLLVVSPYATYLARTWFDLPLWLAFSLGVFTGMIAGYLTERLLYRPLYHRKASPTAVMVASLGAFVIIENVLALAFGNEVRLINRSMATRTTFGLVSLTSIQLAQLTSSAIVLLGLALSMRHLRVFKAIWAMGEEPTLIPVLGLPLMKYRAIVFSLSGGLGGMACCLIAMDTGVDPHMGMSYLLIAAVAMLAGGIDKYVGWILGGFGLAVLQSASVLMFSPKWMDLVTFVVLIGILGIVFNATFNDV